MIDVICLNCETNAWRVYIYAPYTIIVCVECGLVGIYNAEEDDISFAAVQQVNLVKAA